MHHQIHLMMNLKMTRLWAISNLSEGRSSGGGAIIEHVIAEQTLFTRARCLWYVFSVVYNATSVSVVFS